MTQYKIQPKLYPILPAEVGLVTVANSKMYAYEDIRRFGASPSATAAVNLAAIQARSDLIPTSGGSIFIPSFADTAVYQVGGNLTFKAKTRIYSDGRAVLRGVGAVGHIWTVTIQGSLTGAATTIAATITRGDKTVQVVSTAMLSAGQSIELSGSAGTVAEAQNFTNGPQRELNEVLSVTDGTHFVLKYPAAHSYTYDVTYTTQGAVSVVTPKDDVTIEGIDFDAIELVHGYNRRFSLTRSRFLTQGDINSSGTSSYDVTIDAEVTNAIAGSGANANAFFHGYCNFRIRLTSFGGHSDGVQFFGCADGIYNVKVYESAARGVYFYKCDNVNPDGKSTVKGTQVTGITNEALLFNYSYNCEYQGLLDERFKQSSIIEFRGDCDDCRVYPTEIHCPYTYPITWKGQAKNTCKVIGGTANCYNNSGAAYLIDLQIQTGMPYPSMLVEGIRLVSAGPNTGFGIMRSISTTESNVANTSIMTFRGIRCDRGSSNLFGLTGTGAGQKITRFIAEDCHSTTEDNANGAHTIFQLPAEDVRFKNATLKHGTTRKIQLIVGTIDNLHVYNCVAGTLEVSSNVTNIWMGDNSITTYTIPDLSVLKGGSVIGTALLDFPSIAAGGSQPLSISVTGITSGDKVTLIPPAALTAGLIVSGPVPGTNLIGARLFNSTGSAIDPANATWFWQLTRLG